MFNDLKNKVLNSDNIVIEFILDLVFNVLEHDIMDKAAGMAYYLALCVGPFMMVLLMILEDFIQNNVDFMIGILSQYMQNPEIVINPLLNYLGQSGGGTITIIAALVALFSASKAINNLIRYMDEILGFAQESGIVNTIKNRLLSILFTLLFIISIILFLTTFVYGDPISIVVEFLFDIDLQQYSLWNFAMNYLPIVYLFILLFGMYKLLPSKVGDDVLSIKDVLSASVFSTIGWIVASKGFSFYINNFNKNNAMYGVLGNFMVLLLWFFVLMLVILLGTVVMNIFRLDYKHRIQDN